MGTSAEAGPSCGPYKGNARSVQVIITSLVNTYFARVIGIEQTHNTARALAMSRGSYIGELYGGASIVGLAPDECKTVWLSGSGFTAIAGCGGFSNSEWDCGLTIHSSTDVPMDGDLAGLLIYAPMSNSNTMRFKSNGNTTLAVTIFIPAAPLAYNGTDSVNPS